MNAEQTAIAATSVGYSRLDAWHEAMDLAVACYEVSARFPSHERFGLAAQMRRAAVSVPSNIAEGYSRRSRAAYVHHLAVALGSHAEVETQIELSRRLGLMTPEQASRLIEHATRTGRLLSALHRSLARVRSSSPQSPVPSPNSRD